MPRIYVTIPLEEKVARRLAIRGEDDCWEWPGKRNIRGYGAVHHAGKTLMVHRLMYEWATGTPPGDLFVCHKCDNPPCANPNHLFAGTHADNMADCKRKGRTAKPKGITRVEGERHGMAKLTLEQVSHVKALREQGFKLREIGSMFGVCEATVSFIVNGKRWRSHR